MIYDAKNEGVLYIGQAMGSALLLMSKRMNEMLIRLTKQPQQ